MAWTPPHPEDLEVEFLLEVLARRFGFDFRGYSEASMKRRLTAARERLRLETFSELQHRLLHDPTALSEVLPLLTVQVSDMFRDPAYYRVLREQVLPHLATWPSLKVWVAGCADGEELYSLAILFREAGLAERTVFYATDISAPALQRAERGIYPIERVPSFMENYRRSGGRESFSSYYTAAYGSMIMDRSLRDNVVFASHSLVSDSVFAEVQLVSCRNVLIYFKPELQDRAAALFVESLSHGGFLGLGAQETLRFSRAADSFTEFASAERIFRRRDRVHNQERLP